MTTAVLDIGKSNVKLVVFDRNGREMQSFERPNEVVADGLYPHFDLAGLQQWYVETFRALPMAGEIETLVPVTHGAAAVLLEGDGTLALPMLDYEYPGPDEIAGDFRAVLDPFEKTFTPDLPGGLAVGRQLFWLERRFPEAFDRVASVLFYPQYWSWWLSDVRSSEVTSFACHSHLWFPMEGRPSDLVVARGWDRLFPPLRPAFQRVGTVRPELAAKTGLSPSCEVLNGIHDSNASLVPYLRGQAAPFAVVSSGTWTICMSIGGRLATLDPARDMIAGADFTGRPTPTLRFMGGREYAAIAGADGLRAAFGEAELARLVETGSMALPAFVEGVGPYPAARGEIVGPEPEGAAGRAALATLYSALMVDHALDLLDVDAPVFIDGPFAKNVHLVSLLAAFRPERPVFAFPSASGAANGAMLLARWEDNGQTGHGRIDTEPAARLDLPGLGSYRARWLELTRSRAP
ncbi:MAG: FGGY family carbohydrate kinase [Geminicoccaceae bacterium]